MKNSLVQINSKLNSKRVYSPHDSSSSHESGSSQVPIFFLFFFLFLFMSWWLSLWLVLPQWRLFGILQTFSFPVRRDCEISFAGSSILTEIIPIPFYDFREWFTLVLLRNEAEATVRCFLRHFNLKLAQTKMLSWNSWVVSIQHKQK